MTDIAEDVNGRLRSTVAGEARAYDHGEGRPLGPFVVLMAAYGAVVGAGGLAVRRQGLPERLA